MIRALKFALLSRLTSRPRPASPETAALMRQVMTSILAERYESLRRLDHLSRRERQLRAAARARGIDV